MIEPEFTPPPAPKLYTLITGAELADELKIGSDAPTNYGNKYLFTRIIEHESAQHLTREEAVKWITDNKPPEPIEG